MSIHYPFNDLIDNFKGVRGVVANDSDGDFPKAYTIVGMVFPGSHVTAPMPEYARVAHASDEFPPAMLSVVEDSIRVVPLVEDKLGTMVLPDATDPCEAMVTSNFHVFHQVIRDTLGHGYGPAVELVKPH